jgi:hypothetical protein
MIILAVYHGLISKHWAGLQYTSLILSVISAAGIWLMVPESPKWLIGMGRYDQARISLQSIARFNGKVFPQMIKFQEEIFEN